jgi:uncharacterized protein
MPAPDTPPLTTVILKVASRCNLNCTYCYVYNQGDQSWRSRPKFMSDATFDAMLQRVARHCAKSGQTSIGLTFHGGEPLLVGHHRMSAWMDRARRTLAPVDVRFKVQTNATRIDLAWAQLFARESVNVGVSLDGPEARNDAARIDHRGRGSYSQVLRGLDHLKAAGVAWGLLNVMQLGTDPLETFNHARSLGCDSISFIFPDASHDTIGALRQSAGSATPCADFLIPIFDEWWSQGLLDIRVSNFITILQLIMGGPSRSDTFGNGPFQFLVVEADGSIEGLDCLRVCGEGMASTGGSVHTHDFTDIPSKFHRDVIFNGLTQPSGCSACPERSTCGGGYLPHRYRASSGFTEPSVWCADILALFSHIRDASGFSYEETVLRQRALRELAPHRFGAEWPEEIEPRVLADLPAQ